MGRSWGRVPKHLISIIATQDVPPTLHTRQLEWVTGGSAPLLQYPHAHGENRHGGMWLETES